MQQVNFIFWHLYPRPSAEESTDRSGLRGGFFLYWGRFRGRATGCRLRAGAVGPVRPFGAILPTSLRLWAPSVRGHGRPRRPTAPAPPAPWPAGLFPVPCVPSVGPIWGRWWTYLGKVEFEGGDLPRRFGIRGRCGGVLVGKVLTMKVDLPHSPLGPSPFTPGTFPIHPRDLPRPGLRPGRKMPGNLPWRAKTMPSGRKRQENVPGQIVRSVFGG